VQWRQVHIGSERWQFIASADSPVYFRREDSIMLDGSHISRLPGVYIAELAVHGGLDAKITGHE
jgi:hypothetical protein